MKILVTGGAGFIGSHVVDTFVAEGHEVAVLDSLLTGTRANLNAKSAFFEADIRDGDRVRQVFQEFCPEVVCHHAAQISVPESVQDPAADAAVNIVGSLNVWQAARDSGASRIIFASSGGAIYGDARELPVPESAAAAPLSPYGLSKQVFEMYLAQLATFSGMVPVVLRYANVYGPRQGATGEAGVISVFVKKLLAGEACGIFGDGSMTRDYVYVGDVAEANRLALFRGDNGVFNIATGQQTTTLELFSLLRDLVGGSLPEAVFLPERPGEVRYSALDSALAGQVLGWRPQMPLASGLKAVVNHPPVQ